MSLRTDRLAPLAFLVVGLGFAVPPVVNAVRKPDAVGNKDYSLWYEVGRTVRAGGPLYAPGPDGPVQYMYPPTAAVLVFAPLTGLGWVGFVAALAAMTAAAWAGCVWLAARLVGGRPRAVYWLSGAAVGPYVYDLSLLGQVNLVLLAMVLGALLLIRRRRPWAAGGLVGLAVAVKVFPLPVLVYFAARRQWAAVLAAGLACAAAVYVAPGAVRGFDRTGRELAAWWGAMVGDQSGGSIGARPTSSFTRRNQSLVSVSHRLLRSVDAGDRDGVNFRVNVADVSPRAAQAVGYGACVALGAVLLWATRLRFGRTPRADGLEAGMVCALVVLCSPLAWTYFFCWLLPAWAALAGVIWSDDVPRRVRRRAAFGGVIAGLLLASALTEQYDPVVQAYGVTAAGAVVLFLTLAGARRALYRPNSRATGTANPGRCGSAEISSRAVSISST